MAMGRVQPDLVGKLECMESWIKLLDECLLVPEDGRASTLLIRQAVSSQIPASCSPMSYTSIPTKLKNEKKEEEEFSTIFHLSVRESHVLSSPFLNLPHMVTWAITYITRRRRAEA